MGCVGGPRPSPWPCTPPGTGPQGRGDWQCLSLLLVGRSCLAEICLSPLSSPHISQKLLPRSENQDVKPFGNAGVDITCFRFSELVVSEGLCWGRCRRAGSCSSAWPPRALPGSHGHSRTVCTLSSPGRTHPPPAQPQPSRLVVWARRGLCGCRPGFGRSGLFPPSQPQPLPQQKRERNPYT